MLPSQRDATELAGVLNPFERAVVADPWEEGFEDVPQINRAAFDKCVRVVDTVRQRIRLGQPASTSLILSGEPGSGKTHLLARLRRHFEQAMADSRTFDGSAIFVAVRLHTTTTLFWRHMRREMMDSLLRNRSLGMPFLRVLLSAGPDRKLEEAHDLSYNLRTALMLYRDARFIGYVSAWLRGESLPDRVLQQLELVPDESEELEQDSSFRFIVQLCGLIHPTPIVLSLDQVEAIQAHPNDEQSLSELGRALTELHDRTGNLLLVSSMQISFLESLRRVVRGAAADRWLKQHEANLRRLDKDQAFSLLEARMNSVPQLRVLRQGKPALWPLQASDLETVFDRGLVTARMLLYRARDLFADAADLVKTPVIPVEEMLQARLEDFREKAESQTKPQDWTAALVDGLPLLLYLNGSRNSVPDVKERSSVDYVFQDHSGRHCAVAICNQENLTALASRLKKIREAQARSPMSRLIVVRDARLAISPGARKCQTYLDELRRGGAQVYRPSAEAMGALEALRRLLSEAQSGDLGHNGRTVEPGPVEAWMRGRLSPALRELLAVLLGESAAEPQSATLEASVDELADYVDQKFVVSTEQAARELSMEEGDLIQLARDHDSRLGLLEGSPSVLFCLAASASSEAASARR
jgi:hypothetical protein